MDRPFIVIVTGPPGAGKSTLAEYLAREFGLPLVTKDGIKETLFDTLGWHDREWSKKLGHASFELLFHLLESHLEAQSSLIVETAFIPAFHTARFLELKERYGFSPIQVYGEKPESPTANGGSEWQSGGFEGCRPQGLFP